MQKRIDNLKAKLSSMNIDGIYVTNLTNVRYLTGFTGSAGGGSGISGALTVTFGFKKLIVLLLSPLALAC